MLEWPDFPHNREGAVKVSRGRWLQLLAVVLAAAFSYFAAQRPVDFRVYHHAWREIFERHGPVYGPDSGLDWPMHFRYPPLFLLLFVPFGLLPYTVAAGTWAALKFVVLERVVRPLAQRLEWGQGSAVWLMPTLLAGPYLVQEFHYGNAQFFIFALVAAGLLWLRTRPLAAALALGLAASLKVWPVFFLPYLAARREWRVVAWTLVLTAGLTLLPAAYFGWHGNTELLGEWVSQELWPQGGPGENWYPSQSLRGVLLRYLTAFDYAQYPDKNYPGVNLVALNPQSVGWLWLMLAGAGYLGLLTLARRRAESEGWAEHGVAFCALGLLQPFTHRVALVVLLWPAVVAGAGMTRAGALPRWARAMICAAATVAALQFLVPGRAAQRWFQVAGADFLVTCGLAAGLAGMCLQAGTREPGK